MSESSRVVSKVRKERIRYKYVPAKKGVDLALVKCPVCGNGINWTKPVQEYSWNGDIVLLAECYDGDTRQAKRKEHLFIIEIKGLPVVQISKTTQNKESR